MKLYIYSFQHDDHMAGYVPAESLSYRDGDGTAARLSTEEIAEAASVLRQAGWEGDGQLQAMIVPPFFSSEGDNYWFPIYHVKQSNNGTSWIASKYPLAISAYQTP